VLLGGFAALALAELARLGPRLTVLDPNPVWAASSPPPGPSWGLWFGADGGIGIDVFDALLRATPIDLALVGGILLAAAVLGVVLGASAGFLGGGLDLAVIGASDFLVGVPPFFLVLVLFLGLRPFLPLGSNALPLFGLLFVLVLWPYYARPVRAVAQRIRSAPYAEGARAAGAGPGRLLAHHVLPNALYPAFAQLPVDVYNVFFVLTVFPFLGCFGGGGSNPAFAPISIVPSPLYPEWGSLLGYGACFGWSVDPTLDAWWSYVFPGAFVVLFGFAVMLLSDGLERHLSVEGLVR
jgi:peptide/nickel transport system permease protein